jgi:multisubunit Na+/H+ antiporter MnhF subunit
MMMNCMNTGTGALTIAGIRLGDATLALTALLLVLLAAVAAVAVARLCFDLAHRFSNHSSRSSQVSS